MAYINVDEVYILDNTGAQVDTVTDIPFKADAGLTDAQKAQARANLGISGGGGGGGRNLMDNPWLTINQRQTSSGNHTVRPADRWNASYGSGGVSWTRESDGCITITPTNTSSHGDLEQKLEESLFSFLVGKQATLSVMLQDGTIHSGSNTIASGAGTTFFFTEGTVRLQGRMLSSGTISVQAFYGSQTIKAIKLELGSTSTLAQDVPPDYGEELAKCMRYFQRIKGTSTNYAPIGLGFTTSASSGVIAAVLVPLPVPLRATTVTVSKSGNLSLLAGSTSYTPSAITYYDHTEQQLRLNVTASGMTAGQFCYLQFSQSAAYIDLSADL